MPTDSGSIPGAGFGAVTRTRPAINHARTRMSESDHAHHDTVPYAQARDVENPKLHAGVFWCNDCETEFVPDGPVPARTL